MDLTMERTALDRLYKDINLKEMLVDLILDDGVNNMEDALEVMSPEFLNERVHDIDAVLGHIKTLIEDAFELGYNEGLNNIFEYMSKQRDLHKFSLGDNE